MAESTINIYTERGSNVRLAGTRIVFSMGGFAFASSFEASLVPGGRRETYYRMRNGEDKVIFITDQSGYDTLTGGGNVLA